MARNQSRQCNICGGEFQNTTKRGRPPAQCSEECKKVAKNQSYRERFCTHTLCGKQFSLDDPDAAPPYFCSNACRSDISGPGKSCLWCHHSIPPEIARLKGNRYCCWLCYVNAFKDINCPNCSEPLTNPADDLPAPWVRPSTYCSNVCRREAREENEPAPFFTATAIQEYVVKLQRHIKLNKPPLNTLPCQTSDFPFSKADGPTAAFSVRYVKGSWNSKTKRQVSEEFTLQPERDFTPQLQAAIQHRSEKSIEILQAAGLTNHERSIALHYYGIQTGAILPGPQYWATLAQVYPWLPVEVRREIERSEWLSIQRSYARLLTHNRVRTEWAEKLRKLRSRMESGKFLKSSSIEVTDITFTARKIYALSKKISIASKPIPIDEYLTPEDQALLAKPKPMLTDDGEMSTSDPGASYAVAAGAMAKSMHTGLTAPRGFNKRQALIWWKTQADIVEYAHWFCNVLHPGSPAWFTDGYDYEENY